MVHFAARASLPIAVRHDFPRQLQLIFMNDLRYVQEQVQRYSVWRRWGPTIEVEVVSRLPIDVGYQCSVAWRQNQPIVVRT